MLNWDWSSIWDSLLVPVGIIGGIISIVQKVINLILVFFRKLKVKVEDLRFSSTSRKGISEDYWLDIHLLFKNKLGKDTTINKIVAESKYSTKQEKSIIIDINKDKQDRYIFEYFLGKEITKFDGKITVHHTDGKSSVQLKTEYSKEKEKVKEIV